MMDTVHTKKEIIEDLGKHSIEIHEVVESIDHSARKGTQIPHWVWTALAACVTIGLLVFRPDLRRRLCSSAAPHPQPQAQHAHFAQDLNLAVITWNVGEIPKGYFTYDEDNQRKPLEEDKVTGQRDDNADPFEALLTDLTDPDLLVVNFQEVDKNKKIASVCCQWKNKKGLDFCAKKILKVLNERQGDEYVILKTVLPGRALTMTGTAIFVKAEYQDRFPEEHTRDDYVTFGGYKSCLKENGAIRFGCGGGCCVCVDKCFGLDKRALGNKLSIIILLKYKFKDIEQTFTFVNSHFAPNKDLEEGKAKWKNYRQKNAAKTVEAICTLHGKRTLKDIDCIFWGGDFNVREMQPLGVGDQPEYDHIFGEFRQFLKQRTFMNNGVDEKGVVLHHTYKHQPWRWGIELKKKPENEDDVTCDRILYKQHKLDDPVDQEITDYRVIEKTYGYSDHLAVQLVCKLELRRKSVTTDSRRCCCY